MQGRIGSCFCLCRPMQVCAWMKPCGAQAYSSGIRRSIWNIVESAYSASCVGLMTGCALVTVLRFTDH